MYKTASGRGCVCRRRGVAGLHPRGWCEIGTCAPPVSVLIRAGARPVVPRPAGMKYDRSLQLIWLRQTGMNIHEGPVIHDGADCRLPGGGPTVGRRRGRRPAVGPQPGSRLDADGSGGEGGGVIPSLVILIVRWLWYKWEKIQRLAICSIRLEAQSGWRLPRDG